MHLCKSFFWRFIHSGNEWHNGFQNALYKSPIQTCMHNLNKPISEDLIRSMYNSPLDHCCSPPPSESRVPSAKDLNFLLRCKHITPAIESTVFLLNHVQQAQWCMVNTFTPTQSHALDWRGRAVCLISSHLNGSQLDDDEASLSVPVSPSVSSSVSLSVSLSVSSSVSSSVHLCVSLCLYFSSRKQRLIASVNFQSRNVSSKAETNRSRAN